MATDIEILQKEIEKINQRNKRVEADKAWETSLTRKVAIVIVTYLFIVLVLTSIGNDRPIINAIIPVCGYSISTLSIGFLKSWWLKKRKQHI